ncbi:MAG: GNAT family N-acetyltransferase, partial [Muribaculaceae bacterium]|nr:GNAT family N-acetyltransferase [Muribaculaceae bacterium]
MDKLSIYLRPFREDDYKQINIWRNDREIQKLVSTSFKYVSEAIEREWVKSKMMDNRKDIYLSNCLKENDIMIGYISINDIDLLNRTAKGGGIVLDKKYQDGIARHEAGILVRKIVFDDLNINRYEGKCLSEHMTSRIVMEATGYQLEGIVRQSVYKDGIYHDQCIY